MLLYCKRLLSALKLKCDKLLASYAFKFNLCRYIKRGADGTMATTRDRQALVAGSTALDIARLCAQSVRGYAQTFALLRERCCSTCGMSATIAWGRQRHLSRCGHPARGSRARYCSKACQRTAWMRQVWYGAKPEV